MKNVKQSVVNNFISTMDLNEDKKVHRANAIRDSLSYKWSLQTLAEIMRRIDKIYAKR